MMPAPSIPAVRRSLAECHVAWPAHLKTAALAGRWLARRRAPSTPAVLRSLAECHVAWPAQFMTAALAGRGQARRRSSATCQDMGRAYQTLAEPALARPERRRWGPLATFRTRWTHLTSTALVELGTWAECCGMRSPALAEQKVRQPRHDQRERMPWTECCGMRSSALAELEMWQPCHDRRRRMPWAECCGTRSLALARSEMWQARHEQWRRMLLAERSDMRIALTPTIGMSRT
mmetsp:Transcript_70153/g.195184  ORF Transcript_70153/g.195184 Transcript_70153/m.195184 type:complete len:234 (+) Transcript_70153:311-1012(+)